MGMDIFNPFWIGQDLRVSNCLGNNVFITIFEEYPYYNTLSLPFYFLKKSVGTYYV